MLFSLLRLLYSLLAALLGYSTRYWPDYSITTLVLGHKTHFPISYEKKSDIFKNAENSIQIKFFFPIFGISTFFVIYLHFFFLILIFECFFFYIHMWKIQNDPILMRTVLMASLLTYEHFFVSFFRNKVICNDFKTYNLFFNFAI